MGNIDMDNKTNKVMIAKIGLDGHDRGAKVVARALHDAGIDVVYTGIRQRIEDIVKQIIAANVDVLGLSFLAGDHMTMVPKVREQLKKAGRPEMPIIIGGIILQHQIPALLEMGVEKVFLGGTTLEEIVSYIRAMKLPKAACNEAAGVEEQSLDTTMSPRQTGERAGSTV